MSVIPTYSYFRDGYWYVVVSQGHPMAGTKSMALKRKHALSNLRDVLSALPVDGEENAASTYLTRLDETARRLVSEFAA